MENKKLIILIVLGIAAVLSLVYGVIAPGKGRGGPSSWPAISAQEKTPAPSAVKVKRRAVRSKFTSWRRSPFTSASTPGRGSTLTLNGILSSGRTLKACIGDAIVGKGDKVGAYTVVDVRKDSVILNDGAKNIELKLTQ